MATSNIKLFDENKGNMLNDTEFNISTQRLNGLQTGVASSQLQNKAMYQASLVAYAIAQIMLQNGLNANDTDAVSAFVANLSSTMLQKVHDIATTEEAQAGTATGKWMSPALVKAAIDTLAAKAQNILSDETKALFKLDTNAVPDNAFSKIAQELENNKVYMRLLWENASPNGGKFVAQTISVDLSEYQIVYMEYLHNIYDDGTIISGLFTKNKCYMQAVSSNSFRSGLRKITVADDGITFGTCYFSSGDDDANCVPVRIYGVHGVTIQNIQ